MPDLIVPSLDPPTIKCDISQPPQMRVQPHFSQISEIRAPPTAAVQTPFGWIAVAIFPLFSQIGLMRLWPNLSLLLTPFRLALRDLISYYLPCVPTPFDKIVEVRDALWVNLPHYRYCGPTPTTVVVRGPPPPHRR